MPRLALGQGALLGSPHSALMDRGVAGRHCRVKTDAVAVFRVLVAGKERGARIPEDTICSKSQCHVDRGNLGRPRGVIAGHQVAVPTTQ